PVLIFVRWWWNRQLVVGNVFVTFADFGQHHWYAVPYWILISRLIRYQPAIFNQSQSSGIIALILNGYRTSQNIEQFFRNWCGHGVSSLNNARLNHRLYPFVRWLASLLLEQGSMWKNHASGIKLVALQH